jgi:hypothetical protein
MQTPAGDLRAGLRYYRWASAPSPQSSPSQSRIYPTSATLWCRTRVHPEFGWEEGSAPSAGESAPRSRRASPGQAFPEHAVGGGEPRRPPNGDLAAITGRRSLRPIHRAAIIAYFGRMHALSLIRVTRVY